MTFYNDYDDSTRAAAYAQLQFPGTYELAFRDLPEIIRRHCNGFRALDFGCGAGRSSRFLEQLGFLTTGIDISAQMLANARRLDPKGDYHQVDDGGTFPFADDTFDLALSAFSFDNIPSRKKKEILFTELRRVLKPDGRLINLVSTPEIYTNEWASFTTRDYLSDNLKARCGDPVLIINSSAGDREPVTDILWPDENYREIYGAVELELLEMRKLLARPDESELWVNEARIAPWCIYVLRRDQSQSLPSLSSSSEQYLR